MANVFKKILLILLPLICMVAVYLAFDPFEVIYAYKTHYNDPRISYNWDVNQTNTLIRNYDRYHYDSFIFGNSRSKSFLSGDLKGHIKAANVLHYGALAETLYGVNRKIRFMASRRIHMENCLLVFDTSLLAGTMNSTGHLFIKHPAISGESPVDFHLTFFRAFMDPAFLFPYLDYKISGRLRPIFKKKFVTDEMRFDPVNGDLILVGRDRLIRANETKYYADSAAIFYPRDLTAKKYSTPVVQEAQLRLLREIKRIFTADKTNYKVIITPNYDINYLDRGDLQRLREIFGNNNVYDYSGINEFTADIHNYYESSHFRPFVGRRILDMIYAR
jgi:hypothetical protein